MEILGYVSLFFVGFVLGLIGGGGSILTVPIFVFLFGISPEVATSYSLLIVGVAASYGTFHYVKQQKVRFKTGIVFGLPSIAGVLLVRQLLLPAIPEAFTVLGVQLTKDQLIMITFAAIMILASYSLLKGSPQEQEHGLEQPWYHMIIIMLDGLVVGGITGFVGAGGGFLIVPALMFLARLPIKEAVGTSLLIITFKSILGFLGDINSIPMDWPLLSIGSVLAMVGIFVGAKASTKVPSASLKKGFGYFILVMGAFIIAQEILK